ncbi:MAG TPA: hypothetical protein VHZ95_13565, partial [Polyangiales bacterium]|nr:hypothetical protein [Polyangiales bacterium]
ICVDDWSQVFGPLLDAVGRVDIPCLIDLPANASPDAIVTLLQPNGSVSPIDQVANAAACAEQRAFYLVGSTTPQVQLCPVACSATSVAGVELRVALDCNGPI